MTQQKPTQSPTPQSRTSQPLSAVELIEGEMLSVHEVARLCSVSPDWVVTHVQAEVLTAQWRDGECYLSSTVLWRARQIAALETHYDADPQLAGLVTDLIDEVRALRRQVGGREE